MIGGWPAAVHRANSCSARRRARSSSTAARSRWLTASWTQPGPVTPRTVRGAWKYISIMRPGGVQLQAKPNSFSGSSSPVQQLLKARRSASAPVRVAASSASRQRNQDKPVKSPSKNLQLVSPQPSGPDAVKCRLSLLRSSSDTGVPETGNPSCSNHRGRSDSSVGQSSGVTRRATRCTTADGRGSSCSMALNDGGVMMPDLTSTARPGGGPRRDRRWG